MCIYILSSGYEEPHPSVFFGFHGSPPANDTLEELRYGKVLLLTRSWEGVILGRQDSLDKVFI